MARWLLTLTAQDASGVLGKFAEHGVLGLVVLALGLYCWHQHKELRRVETERTKDAQAVTQQLISLNDKWNSAVQALTAALAAQHPMLERMEDLIKETKDALRNRRSGS